jgi:uncharacterized YceG family protein
VREPGGPRQRGRHTPADGGHAGVPETWDRGLESGSAHTYGRPTPAVPAADGSCDEPTGGLAAQPRARARLIPAAANVGFSGGNDHAADETGPLLEPAWWSYGSSDHPDHPLSARHSSDNRPGSWDPRPSGDLPGHTPHGNQHPSGPLPPFPTGAWDRLRPRHSADRGRGPLGDLDDDLHDDLEDDTATVSQPRAADGPPARAPRAPRDHDGHAADDHRREDPPAQRSDPQLSEDRTGGLEVIGAHVADAGSRRWWRRERRAGRHETGPDPAQQDDVRQDVQQDDQLDDQHVDGAAGPDDVHGHGHGDHAVDGHEYDGHEYDGHEYDGHEYDDHEYEYEGHEYDDDISIAPYDPRSGKRSRRRSLAVLLSLLVLGGLVVGIVVGGEKLWTIINPSSADFTGEGTGTVEVRIGRGDTLSDIARTLVDGGVIASVGPFVDAAEADPAATGIQPGVYRMRAEMSGQAAVDLLLDPATRMLTRVTLPEGLTVKATLAKLAEASGRPLPELEAAAANPAALGLPAYAGGTLEGFLFPATYDFEPGTTPTDMLSQMVDRAVHAFDDLQIPEADRLTVLTKASLVQAEASTPEDMAKVARVLENRLADGMPLQLDTTVNYANGKSGITTTSADRANPSPYNTYVHPGLPPGAINNPGEQALRAVLDPAEGEWRFFVVVDPDTGETRFAVTGAEHQQNVLLFQQWLREQPGG